ncbi:hypothetical protein M902_2163 [Bacteriovorax sp. BAL6_X]|uniref:hypothetical protein n=1 Tax=Bacteriovorax sp. BAL6_X TaxID=1201290 RepID=UPI000386EC6F|nr:hypothetical protein [Bacteriovorax sp. BAL6_X]EPZ51907.1 hypothetical protein M902_2163 [Bacteriovorax sp. BAL6_X]
MNIENFRETFIAHARDEIKSIISQSKIKGEFNSSVFNEKLEIIWSEAQINGLTEYEFATIVEEVIPTQIDNIIFPFNNDIPLAA